MHDVSSSAPGADGRIAFSGWPARYLCANVNFIPNRQSALPDRVNALSDAALIKVRNDEACRHILLRLMSVEWRARNRFNERRR
jgi:hypothetical protein